MNILHETPDKYTKVTDVKYMYGARTVALDPKTHDIFSVGGTKMIRCRRPRETENPRPRPELTTFSIVEIGNE